MSLTTHKGGGGKKLLGHLGALVTVIAWGSSFVFTKVLMEDGHFSPVETYVYRFVLAYLCLLPFTLKRIFARNWRDEMQLALCGICSGTLYFVLENYALKLTSTANVALLSSMSPLFTALLFAIVFHTSLKKGVIWGSIVAIVGVAMVILAAPLALGEGLKINPAGDLLALSSAVAWAIYGVGIKRLTPLYSTTFITRKMFFYGVLTALPLMLIGHEPTHLGLLFNLSQPQFLINMLFLVLICSVMGYVIWNEAIKILGPVSANNYIYIQPIVTMILGAIWLHETIYVLSIIGCILIIGGLIAADKIK